MLVKDGLATQRSSELEDILAFLDSADQVGKNIGTTINVVEAANEDAAKRTVSMEARMIKRFFLKLRD